MNKIPEYNELKQWYSERFKDFEAKLNGESGSFFHQLRKDAIGKLNELYFPHSKNEDWKYTNISPVLKYNFKPAVLLDDAGVSENLIEKSLVGQADTYNFVFVNGKIYSASENLPAGVKAVSLAKLMKENPGSLKDQIAKISGIENSFNALNTAFATDGFALIINDNVELDKPVQVLFLSGHESENVAANPRNFIAAGKNSKAEIIFNYKGFGKNVYLNNAVTEAYLDESAKLNIYSLQDENSDSFHIEKTQVSQKSNSCFSNYSFALDGKIIRNDINTSLDDQHCEAHFYGLYLGRDEQLIDHHTFVDHATPNCESNELYKGILDDNSRGVFNGKILVRQDAQKTNAFQSNKAVLLSKEAKIDTKPQLEIYADDVKCSHGAAVGRLDQNADFYIRSRGIPADIAKSMLLQAFASDVVEKVEIEELKDILNKKISEHLF